MGMGCTIRIRTPILSTARRAVRTLSTAHPQDGRGTYILRTPVGRAIRAHRTHMYFARIMHVVRTSYDAQHALCTPYELSPHQKNTPYGAIFGRS